MTQRMGGDRRGLGNPTTLHALITVCRFIVPCADEMLLVNIGPQVWIPTRRGSR